MLTRPISSFDLRPRDSRFAWKVSDGFGPITRVVIIVLGTLLGLLLIPRDAQPLDAMRGAAVVLTLALLMIPAAEGLILGVKPALKIRNLLLLGVVYWLLADLVQGLYRIDATTDGIETAFLAIGVFAVGLSLGGAFRLGRLPAGIHRLSRLELTDRQLLGLTIFCFLTGIFYYFFKASFSINTVMDGLLNSRFSAPWARGQLGDWTSFIEQLTYFGYLLPPLTAIMYMRARGPIDGRTVFCAVLTVCFLVFPVQGGGRTGLGAVLGSAIIVGILLSRKTLNIFHVAALISVAFAAQVTMNIILENRSHGFGEFEVGDWTLTTVRVDDNFNRLAQTADFVPRYYPYSGLQFVYFSLVRPIPRALWPGKPINQGFTVQEALGEANTSLTNSVIGEAYSGFGFPLVLLMGMCFGWAARWWEQVLEGDSTTVSVLLYALGAMALFGSLRGFVNVILLSYPILSLWAAFHVFKFIRSRQTNRGPLR